MSDRLGDPPQADAVRAVVDERLAEAELEQGEKLTVEYRGAQRHLYVVAMPVDMLMYNPFTHRVRAQRTSDPERNRILDEDPWGPAAQAYLHDLLTWRPSSPGQVDPDYEQLKDELKTFGQREPGVITCEGVLANGNTRCAALRDLGLPDIRVGVLPGSSTMDDVNRVELALQLRRDKRREYSYMNRLITIDEQLASGRKEEDIARDFNIRVQTLQRDRWVYKLIRDAIRRSEVVGGGSLALADFEEHQEKLRELSRDYFKLKSSDPDAAEQLKESRLQMVLLNYAKTSLRLAESDFHARYLKAQLPESLMTSPVIPQKVAVPGLEGVEVPDGSSGVKETAALTDAILRAKAMQKDRDHVGTSELVEADKLITQSKKSFERAVELAGRNAQLRKRAAAVPDRLTDAADYINQAVGEFAEARARGALDEDAFDDALGTLRESLAKLARQASRAFDAPSDGVEWLLTTSGTTIK